MELQILVEHPRENLFVASVPDTPDCLGTGTTEEEAVKNLQAVLDVRRARSEAWMKDPGTELMGNPWLDSAGIFADDPTWEEFQANIAEYRRQQEEEDATRWAAEELTEEADKAA